VPASRLNRVFDALGQLGVIAEPVVYSDERVEQVRSQLLGLSGVLVWVNPIEQGHDRSKLDPLLRQVSAAGVWVSAQPDVILKMGTKEVLFRSREMSWGTDTHLYRTFDELKEQLPAQLASGGPRVLKQNRGMGGNGVWRVELTDANSHAGLDLSSGVRVLHALGDRGEERLSLGEFIQRCDQYFIGPGLMIDQPFQERLADGMIRVYLTHDKVVGFAHQHPSGLLTRPPERVALPSLETPRQFEGRFSPRFRTLRERMESEWIPALQQLLEVETRTLPVIWDADFLYGPKTRTGDDSYVLCEINVSSTFPFPEQGLETVARAAMAGIREAGRS
jgi:hypothetical protein